ncbi:MAG TPA: ArsA-related P-loop ATPase [Acidimicrobiales bacterium]|nr:ArsA-related P-loop ATPase [Acidimicrobiales bacterium]
MSEQDNTVEGGGGGLGLLVNQRSIVVCCGSGGVGKTTTAAAVALEGARRGRRACVVTIDPAKRLADALGLAALANTPRKIEGDWPGELWAMMLDTKSTFDDLVLRYAPSREQAESILRNRLYRNLAGALSGTQEYMAMEKLYELHEDGVAPQGADGEVQEPTRFDLIVVDTPPTRSALDFLDAPRRLTRFLDNRIFRLLVMPTRAYLKAVSVATQTFLRAVSRVVGSEVVGDAVDFFRAFEGMEQGFRDRAGRVLELLSDRHTAFVLVAAPRRDAVEEAMFFAQRLAEGQIRVEALVVNRLHPRFPTADEGEPRTLNSGSDRARAESLSGTALGTLYANLAQFREVAEREERHFATLAERVAPAPVVRVPFLAADVHDIEGLGSIAAHLFERAGTGGAGDPARCGATGA